MDLAKLKTFTVEKSNVASVTITVCNKDRKHCGKRTNATNRFFVSLYLKFNNNGRVQHYPKCPYKV